MLKISDEIKQGFLRDSEPKQLEITADDSIIDTLNFYNGRLFNQGSDPTQDYEFDALSINSGDSYKFACNKISQYQTTNDLSTATDVSLYSRRKYFCVSVELYFYNVTTMPNTIRLALVYYRKNGQAMVVYYTYQTSNLICPSVSPDDSYYTRLNITYNDPELDRLYYLAIDNTSQTVLNAQIKYRRFMVNFGNETSKLPISYVYTDFSTIDFDYWNDAINISNENLVAESFSLSESLCSEENIKFGLCEAAYCSFTVAEKFYPYKDKRIKPVIKLRGETSIHDIVQEINFYKGTQPVPGSSTGSGGVWTNVSLTQLLTFAKPSLPLKITNDYLNYGNFIRITFDCSMSISAADIMPAKVLIVPSFDINTVTGGTASWRKEFGPPGGIAFTVSQNDVKTTNELVQDFTKIHLWLPIDFANYYLDYGYDFEHDNGVTTINNIGYLFIIFLDENNNKYTDSSDKISFTLLFKNWQINLVDTLDQSIPTYNPADCVEYFGSTIPEYINSNLPQIPFGVFNITEVEKDYVRDSVKYNITAYDDLTLLEQNAADWYTMYMYGVQFNSYTSNGFQFARQIFSTYWNYITSMELDSRNNYSEEILYDAVIDSSTVGNNYIQWSDSFTVNPYNTLHYGYFDVDVSSVSSRIFVVDIDNKNDRTDFQNLVYFESYGRRVDEYGRGIINNSEVLITETKSDNTTNSFCINNGDYFMVSKDCISIRVFVPYKLVNTQSNQYLLVSKVRLSSVDMNIDLENGWIRLLYYNYNTKEIFSCDSSITGREVIHSLLEPCGCFFRLNRYNGRPEFIYCTKAGLYPRDDLYPADDLYPRTGVNDLITMDKYEEFRQQDYVVQKYGRIQIRKNITSNESKSICQWEYEGDPDCINTYIIDDNIFYCHESMEYDYDNMPEVSQMLANMYNRISNMDYTPNITKCIGMPWIECGDRIGVLTKTGGAESFVFKRELRGIQSLHDTLESEGDEYIEAIKDYDYKVWEG